MRHRRIARWGRKRHRNADSGAGRAVASLALLGGGLALALLFNQMAKNNSNNATSYAGYGVDTEKKTEEPASEKYGKVFETEKTSDGTYIKQGSETPPSSRKTLRYLLASASDSSA